MNNNAFSYLNFIHFSQLNLWDFKRYISKVVSSKYPIVKLANFINEENKKIKPFDFPEEKFEILGVNNKTGLFDAYIEDGNKINQPYKIVENGFLAYNPYRINVGSIGLKTKEQKYKYISPAYVVFSCKKDLLPEFLYILFRTDKFNELIRENTTGSVRQTLSFSSMGQIQIPLPSLEKQKEIVDRYNAKIKLAEEPKITCQCLRVPVLNGHTAAVFINFEKKPTKEQLIEKLESFKGFPQEAELPSAPKQFIQYLEEDDRPQVKLDVNYENGMGVSLGRLREDSVFDYKFVGLSHNTLRGAAGGAVLIAELLKAQGYITPKDAE